MFPDSRIVWLICQEQREDRMREAERYRLARLANDVSVPRPWRRRGLARSLRDLRQAIGLGAPALGKGAPGRGRGP